MVTCIFIDKQNFINKLCKMSRIYARVLLTFPLLNTRKERLEKHNVCQTVSRESAIRTTHALRSNVKKKVFAKVAFICQ